MGSRSLKWKGLSSLLLAGIIIIWIFCHHPTYWTGVNVKMSAEAPWGSPASRQSMQRLAHDGAKVAMQVAFAWQATPESDTPVLGSDSQPDIIRKGLKDIKAAGLKPVLKIHLWIPSHWAGQVAPAHPDIWFRNYSQTILPLVKIAQEEDVGTIIIATELRGVEKANGWPDFVHNIRQIYKGKLAYDTDNLQQAEDFQHWDLFDIVTTSLYTALPDDKPGRLHIMENTAQRLKKLGQKWNRPVWVAELGIRSAQGLLSRPWASPEEVTAAVNLDIQKEILEDWRNVVGKYGIKGISFWCWYTNPHAGGTQDTDFTPQNKPAESVLKRPFLQF